MSRAVLKLVSLIAINFFSEVHVNASDRPSFTNECQEMVESKLNKFNQFRFKQQCHSINSRIKLDCLSNILNSKRSISLIDFNACSMMKSEIAYKSFTDFIEYYSHTINSHQVSLTTMVENESQRKCLSSKMSASNVNYLNASDCFSGSYIRTMRQLALIYIL